MLFLGLGLYFEPHKKILPSPYNLARPFVFSSFVKYYFPFLSSVFAKFRNKKVNRVFKPFLVVDLNELSTHLIPETYNPLLSTRKFS